MGIAGSTKENAGAVAFARAGDVRNSGPVRLLTAHKILIGAAIGLALLLCARSTWLYAVHGSRPEGGLALVALSLALALGWYFRQLFRR